MNFDEFSSDLPPQQAEWFTTPEALESALDGYGIFQPTLQFRSGEFRAGLAQRKTESCELFADRYSTALSLLRCFREYFDFTITDYLKTVRLDSVYRELLVASPDEETVTRIALHNGFTHLGRFSIAFNLRFSTSPSEVLQMRKD
jgi:hypothetical protein